MALRKNSRRRLGVTLIEVMVASMLGVLTTATAIASVAYYQTVTAKNDRIIAVGNVLTDELENVRNRTWASLADPTIGIFPPGGPGSGVWPARTGPFTRREAVGISPRTIVNTTSSVSNDFNGLAGQIRVFYTPIVREHRANARDGTLIGYDVRYYKVEVTLTLDQNQRVRPGPTSQPDTWSMVTYISELGGRSEAEFQQRVLEQLRLRQRVI